MEDYIIWSVVALSLSIFVLVFIDDLKKGTFDSLLERIKDKEKRKMYPPLKKSNTVQTLSILFTLAAGLTYASLWAVDKIGFN